MNYQIKHSYTYNLPQILSAVHLLIALKRISDKRSCMSYVKEWYAHNILYKLGLFKSHTRDVDLNDDESLIKRFVYNVIYYITFGWIKIRKK